MVKHDHVFKPTSADKLLSEERQIQMPAASIIEQMDIQKDDIVADFGAGNGYFTLPLAAHTTEMVYAIDAEPKMLELLKVRAREAELENIEYIEATIEATSLKTDAIDKLLISRTIHHAIDLDQTIEEIKRVLHFDGLLYIIEFYKDETIEGPPMDMRLAPEDLCKALSEIGFKTETIRLNEAEYAVKASLK